jgi:hypothetical protein
MVTKWDKIAFVLIAVLLVLAIVFRHDLSGAFARKENPGGKEDKKGKNTPVKSKAPCHPLPHRPSLALWPFTPQPTAFPQHPARPIPFNI